MKMKNYLFVFLFFFVSCFKVHAQEDIHNMNNNKSDTLIQIGTYIIDSVIFSISRDTIVDYHKLQVNKKGLKVVSFTLTAFSLGSQVKLTSDSNNFTLSMMKVIQNNEINYKFINIKNIIFADDKDVRYQSSLSSLRIYLIDN